MAAASKPINSKALFQELGAKKLSTAYLFLGEEEGEKDKAIKLIGDILFGTEGERKNSTGNFHINNGELMDAAAFTMLQSMFSYKKLCLMRGFESSPSGKQHQSTLRDVIEGLPDGTCLVMTSTENRVPSIIPSDLAHIIKTVQFWKHFENDTVNYVNIAASKAGLRFTDKAMSILLDRTGRDIKKIDDTIEMVKFYGASKEITPEILKDLLNDNGGTSVYDFIEALFRRNPGAPVLLKRVLDDGTSEGRIIFEIIKHLEKIESYFKLTSQGMTIDEAVSKSGIFPRNANNFLRHTRSFPPEKVQQLYSGTVKTDWLRKSSGRTVSLASNPLLDLVALFLSD